MRISTEDNARVFWFEAEMNGSYLETAAMNSHGFFGNFQGNLSSKHKNIQPGPGKVGIDQVFRDSLRTGKQIADLKTIIGDRTVIYPPVPPEWNLLHNLFADKFGGSLILETSEGHNDITEITGKFMVMTNFPAGEFKNKPLAEISGAGDDRYKIAYEHLAEMRHCDVAAAFDLLKKTAQNTDGWKTLCSMIFDPNALKVHCVFNQQFEYVFTANIQDCTLEIPKDEVSEVLPCVFEGFTIIRNPDSF